jgi:hypothetical protein
MTSSNPHLLSTLDRFLADSRKNCSRTRFRLRFAFLWLAWATFVPLSGGVLRSQKRRLSRSDLLFYRRLLVFAPRYRDLTTLDRIDRTGGKGRDEQNKVQRPCGL